MRKLYLFIVLFIIIINAKSAEINENTAKNVAKTFIKSNSNANIASEVDLIYTKFFENASAAFYIFQLKPQGFVIISANDCAIPILGYSFENNFQTEKIPASVEWWLNGYKKQIEYAVENNISASEEVQIMWERYLSNNAALINNETKAVANFLTTTWDQKPYYNDLCPDDCPTGCVATAMAQVMKYYSYPIQGTGSHSYNAVGYGNQLANFGTTTYDWNNMPNSIGAANYDIAQLMYHCGVSVNMNYGPTGSGASLYNAANALQTYFGYSSACQYIEELDYSSSDWKNTMKQQIDNSNPVIYGGQGSGGGHAFIFSGYDNSDKFYVNWGWGGNGPDGFYALGALNPPAIGIGGGSGSFNSANEAIINIFPDVSVITIIPFFNMEPSDLSPGGQVANIIEGECVKFTDVSYPTPTSWTWGFPGSSTPTWTGKTPPLICYEYPGTYDAVLTVSNNTSVDTYTYVCEGCIIVSPDPYAPIIDFKAKDNKTIIQAVSDVVLFENKSINGPFSKFIWEFEGGTPSSITLTPPITNPQPESSINPPPVAYITPGEYKVTLRAVKDGSNKEKVCTKQQYIKVVAPPTNAPVADFIANNTFINTGDNVNFIDLSTGTPFSWKWEFQNGTPASSLDQYPQNIKYNAPGSYKVKLTVTNPKGNNSLTKESYIIVGCNDTCTEAPITDFTAKNRVITAGQKIYYANNTTITSPTNFLWTFNGGYPSFSTESSPSIGITYSTPGIYSVTLQSTNACGDSIRTKEKYIYVFSALGSPLCDYISSRISTDGNHLEAVNPNGGYGYILGHSSEKYRTFATYIENDTYNEINSITIPINTVVVGAPDSYAEFYIWEPNGNKPNSVELQKKRVFLKDLKPYQDNTIIFDSACYIDKSFYVGFRINYPDVNQDNQSDDRISAYMFNRGSSPSNNKLFFRKLNTDMWKTTNEIYDYSAAMDIKVNVCLVPKVNVENIEVAEEDIAVYPNPTNENITIQLNENYNSKVEFMLYDILGKQHKIRPIANTTNEYNINLSDLQSGMYYLQIRTNSQLTTKKIILTK